MPSLSQLISQHLRAHFILLITQVPTELGNDSPHNQKLFFQLEFYCLDHTYKVKYKMFFVTGSDTALYLLGLFFQILTAMGPEQHELKLTFVLLM